MLRQLRATWVDSCYLEEVGEQEGRKGVDEGRCEKCAGSPLDATVGRLDETVRTAKDNISGFLLPGEGE